MLMAEASTPPSDGVPLPKLLESPPTAVSDTVGNKRDPPDGGKYLLAEYGEHRRLAQGVYQGLSNLAILSQMITMDDKHRKAKKLVLWLGEHIKAVRPIYCSFLFLVYISLATSMPPGHSFPTAFTLII